MSDYEKGVMTKGVIKGVKLNVEKSKSNGEGSFLANMFQLETNDGDVVKHVLPAKSAAGKYVAKLKVGDKVTVKTGGRFNSVLAVFQNDGKFSKEGFKKDYNGSSQTKTYDPTGPIQGMVLASAANLVATTRTKANLDDKGQFDKEQVVRDIVEAAKCILSAKSEVDKLVVEALKGAKDDDDSDDDFSDDNTTSSNNKRNKQVDDEDDFDNVDHF